MPAPMRPRAQLRRTAQHGHGDLDNPSKSLPSNARCVVGDARSLSGMHTGGQRTNGGSKQRGQAREARSLLIHQLPALPGPVIALRLQPNWKLLATISIPDMRKRQKSRCRLYTIPTSPVTIASQAGLDRHERRLGSVRGLRPDIRCWPLRLRRCRHNVASCV
jgi:hypothetical protein